MEEGKREQQQPPLGRVACPCQDPGEGAEGAALPERPEPEEPDRHRHPRAALTAPGVPRARPAPPAALSRAAPPGGTRAQGRGLRGSACLFISPGIY